MYYTSCSKTLYRFTFAESLRVVFTNVVALLRFPGPFEAY